MRRSRVTITVVAAGLCLAADDPTLADAMPHEVLGVPEGVEPIVSQTSEVWTVLAGGYGRGTVYTGLLTLGTEVDLDALGLHGAPTLGVVGLGIQGQNVSTEAVGDASIVSNIAGVPAVRLYQAWIERRWADAVHVKGGVIALDDDFMLLESALLFVNSGFGTPQTEALNTPAPIYPLGALGGVGEVAQGAWSARLGVYDGDAADLAPDAPIVLAEVGWQRDTTHVAGGGFGHARGLGSVWLMAEHRLGEVTAFARAATAFPAERAVASVHADAGIVLGGGVWGRADDAVGLGVAHTVFGGAATGETPHETVLELTYRAVPVPWITLQPSSQWVLDPHFSARDAWVLGIRANVAF